MIQIFSLDLDQQTDGINVQVGPVKQPPDDLTEDQLNKVIYILGLN